MHLVLDQFVPMPVSLFQSSFVQSGSPWSGLYYSVLKPCYMRGLEKSITEMAEIIIAIVTRVGNTIRKFGSTNSCHFIHSNGEPCPGF